MSGAGRVARRSLRCVGGRVVECFCFNRACEGDLVGKLRTFDACDVSGSGVYVLALRR